MITMNPTNPKQCGNSEVDVDHFVDKYEEAKARNKDTRVSDFLPDGSHPAYRDIVLELLRVDLEHAWRVGDRRGIEAYRTEFSELFTDRDRLNQIAFEEYRLRWQSGDRVDRQDFGRRFGVDAGSWPTIDAEGDTTPGVTDSTWADLDTDHPSAAGDERDSLAAIPSVGDRFLSFLIIWIAPK